MFQPAARAALRSSQCSLAPARTVVSRRFITTEAPHLRSRSWKSSALRWGIAIAGIYYYNTSPVFAEYPQNNLLNPNVDALEDENSSSTLDALTASSRRKKDRDPSALQSAIEDASAVAASDSTAVTSSSSQHESAMATPLEGAAELEEEAEGEAAFNPVTGEINWDCPCLGGMAYGPCGNEFREAFSCFVYSTEEPKGMNCIDKFQSMQTCFRAHPEVYKGELEDDEELDESLAQEKEELQKEISERRATVDAQEDSTPPGRLLEEPGSVSASVSAPKKSQSTSKSSSNSVSKKGTAKSSTKARNGPAPTTEQVRSETSPMEEAKTTTAGYEDEYRHGAASAVNKKLQNSSVSEAVAEAEELVPKAAFDASEPQTNSGRMTAK